MASNCWYIALSRTTTWELSSQVGSSLPSRYCIVYSLRMKRMYLDHAALTPVDKKVLKEMEKYSSSEYANPSSIHTEGVRAKKALEEARRKAAAFLRALPDEIIFTGSGTEANNLAIIGLTEMLISTGKKYSDLHMITSVIEHPSVLECAQYLEKKGVRVEYVGVNGRGIVNVEDIKKLLRPETFLVSIMMVNNEIGTIQPVRDIAKVIRNYQFVIPVQTGIQSGSPHSRGRHQNVVFHTDASQAPCYLDLNVEKFGVDLLTLDAHKVYGPRGIGLLYTKRGIELAPLVYGGGQEKGVRSGTENLPAIMGFAKALEIAASLRDKETARLTTLRDYCISKLADNIKGVVLNGDALHRIANNINISIPDIDNEYVVLFLDAQGIAVATKSSCLRDEAASYVVKALGRSDDLARRSVRISLGRDTKKSDIDYVVKIIKKVIDTQI